MNTNFNDVTFAAEFLHTVQPFNTLAGEELQWLASRLEVNYYPQGTAIFASKPPPGLAIIRKGAARFTGLNGETSHEAGAKTIAGILDCELHGHPPGARIRRWFSPA